MGSLLRGGGNAEETTKNITDRLMHALVKDYSLERYYNRHKDISSDKLETYYTIIQYIYEKYHNKTLLQDISSNNTKVTADRRDYELHGIVVASSACCGSKVK